MKTKQLSFMGRVMLVKILIEAINIYPMMTDMLPKACVEDIQKLYRNFVWGIQTRKGVTMQ